MIKGGIVMYKGVCLLSGKKEIGMKETVEGRMSFQGTPSTPSQGDLLKEVSQVHPEKGTLDK